jgi:hypothetical protein
LLRLTKKPASCGLFALRARRGDDEPVAGIRRTVSGSGAFRAVASGKMRVAIAPRVGSPARNRRKEKDGEKMSDMKRRTSMRPFRLLQHKIFR